MPSAKKLLNISSIVVGGLLLIVGSSVYGVYYGSKLGVGELTKQLASPSPKEQGHLLEQLKNPTKRERDLGKQALKEWVVGGWNSYQRAYDIVLGKALDGMNAVEVLYVLGAPAKTIKDGELFRYKYLVKGDHLHNELYVTFKASDKKDPTVIYTGLFYCDY